MMDKGILLHMGRAVDPTGMFATGQNPFEMDGALFFPAVFMRCGICTKDLANDGDKLVQLDLGMMSMLGNQMFAFLRMTPDGARFLAEHLLANAQQVEAHVAAQASAAIEAARGGGAQEGRAS